jgi:Pretoxin HINT domain
LKPIEEIKKGDEVLSYNQQTGQNEYQTVRQTFKRYAQDVLSVKIEGQSEPIGVTSEHPFFVRVRGARSNLSNEDDGEWRQAGEFQAGDEIRTASGDWARVEAIETRADEFIYNFEISFVK